MIAIAYHADIKEVQSDPALAGALECAQPSAPFDRLEWFDLLARHCGIAPLFAGASDGDDAVVLALTESGGRAEALANWYTFRWRPLYRGAAIRPDLLSALARALAQRYPRIDLKGVPDEDGEATALCAALRDTGWLVWRERCDTNHVLPVGERSWDAYRAGLPGRLRTTLKRKSGKLDCAVLTHFDPTVWDAYEAIYRESWKPEEGSPDFLRAFARQEAGAGRLRLGLARHDGAAVAAQMWTVEGHTAFIHKLAHRQDATALSPGSVLSAALFRHVLDIDAVALVDFGTGDDAYKRDWMEVQRPRFRIRALRPANAGNWPEIARMGLGRLAGGTKRG